MRCYKQLQIITVKQRSYKPIASGVKQLKNCLINPDSQLFKKNSSLKLNYHNVNSIVFKQHHHWHITSWITGKVIDWKIMNIRLNKLKQSY
ncbi:MAG: hypothetical protein ACTS8A_01375 [Arsenophonus sp. ET-LJ4-MAG3]